jgi:molybdopterin/thiamine biosynthesis adenylyltransferase
MRTTLALHEGLWQELTGTLAESHETAGVILAGVAVEAERLTLVGNRILWVPADAYDLRAKGELKIRSEGWMPALRAAKDEGFQPVFFHSHPRVGSRPSKRDDEVDAQLGGPFRHRGDADRYVSLIIGGTREKPTFTGRVIDDDGTRPLDRIRAAGPRLRLLAAEDGPVRSSADLTVFDRQILAFGVEGQRAVADLRVGVAGAGGTGSPVIEELIRLGVAEIIVVDDDTVSDTNITRIHGSTMADVGKPKATLAEEQATAIGLRAKVTPVLRRVTERAGMEALRLCDVVFGCTDDFAGRAVLSRLAYYYAIPVIDLGVMITPQDDGVEIYGRLNVIAAGHPCLYCTGDITPRQVHEDLLDPGERARLAEEGYAQELDERDPAVVAYTTAVASFAIDTLLQRLFGLGAEPAGTTVIWFGARTIRSLPHKSQDGCFCADTQIWGRGDREPPLDQIWTK